MLGPTYPGPAQRNSVIHSYQFWQLVQCSRINLVYTLALFFPTAYFGYRAYGDRTTSNILEQLPAQAWTVHAACYLLAAHMVWVHPRNWHGHDAVSGR